METDGKAPNGSGFRNFRKAFTSAKKFRFSPEVPCRLIDYLGDANYIKLEDDSATFKRAVNFFRNILNEIEVENHKEHFKLFVNETPETGFLVNVVEVHRQPPRKVQNCLACDTESETNRTSRLEYSFTKNQECNMLHQIWLDAKARPMFIITPIRHIERLSECTDDEIFQMFYLACKVLEEETINSKAPWERLEFEKMTLNHGNARNLAHLHLKVSVKENQFNWFREHGWDQEKIAKYNLLLTGLYRKDKRLKKLK
ncbi:hypothetical protein G9A89_022856 [Geosiphon pyriformis]|nr:hypothetical protein G9A89_022856 [Geosiphon pyriformis]